MRFSQSGQFCAAMALALAGPSAAAEFLPILNPGFELLNVSLRPGEQTNGAGGVPLNSGLPQTPVNTRWQFPFSQGDNTPQSGVLVPGWRTASPGSGSLAGVLNPDVTFGGTPWMTGFEGRYVGAAQAAFMSQTINRRLAPNTRYTLSFLAGIGITDSEYTPLLRLLATPDLVTFPTPGQPGIDSLAFVPFDGIIRRPDFRTSMASISPSRFSAATASPASSTTTSGSKRRACRGRARCSSPGSHPSRCAAAAELAPSAHPAFSRAASVSPRSIVATRNRQRTRHPPPRL
jgi:hypothetical protein